MKTNSMVVIGAVALSFASATHTFAITNTAIAVSGTNIVLSWPSSGYEIYLVRSRQTLSLDDSWSCITNAYPANSTNRTTFTIYGVVPPPATAANGNDGTNIDESPPSPDSTSSSLMAEGMGPLVIRDDGSGGVVPLKLYPPGFDLSGFTIFDPSTGESVSGSTYTISALSLDDPQPSDGGGGGDPGDPSAVVTQFFEVFQIPDFPASITNSIFDGPTFIPIATDDYGERPENFEVLIDGEPMAYADYMSMFYNGQTNWGMGIYFDRLTNGTHQIQLVSTVHINDAINYDAVYLVLSNLTRAITVSNQVTFPDWNDFIQGDTYTFNAQLANHDTDWQIDIYDSGNNYVNSGFGHTYDGNVSWTWNLMDYWGNNRDNFDSDPYFYSQITFNAATSGAGNNPQSQVTAPTPIPVKGYPDRGEWLIAFQDRWFSDAPGYGSDCQDKFNSAMQSIWYWPQYVGDTTMWYPIRFGTNVYSQADRDYSWTNLLAWIGDLYVRNLYYHGHGGANELGADRHTLDTNGLVNGSALTSIYSKAQIFSWQAALKTRYNRYRFVFLDGCSTAAGSWPSAFSISMTNHDVSFYENHPKHPRPSVFVGWAKDIGGKDYGNVYDRLNFQGYWMPQWADIFNDDSIKDALEQANSASHWLDASKFREDIRYYGYQNMHIQDYNKKGDWRWP